MINLKKIEKKSKDKKRSNSSFLMDDANASRARESQIKDESKC
jgi:hypothetical protein